MIILSLLEILTLDESPEGKKEFVRISIYISHPRSSLYKLISDTVIVVLLFFIIRKLKRKRVYFFVGKVKRIYNKNSIFVV